MRCPDCNKFVSFDAETEPEIDVDFDEMTRTINGSVRIVNNCAECSTELKETTFDVDIDLSAEIEDHWKEHGWKDGDAEAPEGHGSFDLSDDGGSRSERSQTHDRHGKPIRNPRYSRRYYGATAVFTVACECGHNIEHQWEDEVQGSGMEELV
jgi:hypothetical protein